MSTPEEVAKVWSSFGLNSQAFPIYYAMGPTRFIDGKGEPTGKKGSIARLSRALSNSPHMLIGLRVQNVINFPDFENATNVANSAIYEMARLQGPEQTVRINLSQQNISADAVLQSTLCGDGQHWHPFPAPFPMAGGNEIEVEIQRVSSYPDYNNKTPVIPEVYVTLVAAVLRTDLSQPPSIRRQ